MPGKVRKAQSKWWETRWGSEGRAGVQGTGQGEQSRGSGGLRWKGGRDRRREARQLGSR